METLLRLYPGDHVALVVANVLVGSTLIVLVAATVTRFAAQHKAALRHAMWLSTLICVLVSPFAICAMRGMGMYLIELPAVSESSTLTRDPLVPIADQVAPAEPQGVLSDPSRTDGPTHSALPFVVPDERERILRQQPAAQPFISRIA